MGFNVWGPTEADSWPVGRPRGAEKRGLVYICIYVYTGVGVGRTELVVGWYSMIVPPARLRCIADFYAAPAEDFINRRSAGVWVEKWSMCDLKKLLQNRKRESWAALRGKSRMFGRKTASTRRIPAQSRQ